MSKVSKHLILGFTAAAIALIPVAWRLLRVQHRLYAASTASTSFTIQQHSEITGPHAGNAAVVEIRTIAIRGDGSRVDVNREPRKQWIERNLQLSTGLLLTVYDDVRVVSTSQLTPGEYERHLTMAPDPAANCTASIAGKPLGLRPSTIQGLDTRVWIPVAKILNGSGLTVWQAPSLACVALEHFIDWDSAHPGTNTSALKGDSVTLGEPDPSLFNVPVAYAEMLPSQAKATHLRFANVPESAVQGFIAQWAKADQFYLAHRPAAGN